MNPLFEIISREVEKNGFISFARFMELALYCPVCGYYEKEGDNLGCGGDYFTSVSVGGLFGELLAFQFAEWLEQLRRADGRVRLVEAGAHHGQLAKDILGWLRERRKELFDEIEYCIIEPSPRQRERQKKALDPFRGRVCWVAEPAELKPLAPPGGIRGVIFANELLDAMPVHRIGWDAASKEWFEWAVTVDRGTFGWMKVRNSPLRRGKIPMPVLPPELLELLPDEFTTETCPAAGNWWSRAAAVLGRGKLLTIDYGLAAEEFFAPARRNGTLRGFRRQHPTNDPLTDVGEQDLTSHVNFTEIQKVGEAAGLKTEAFLTQEEFLVNIAGQTWKEPASFGEWTSARVRQFQTLSHPEHLGRPFRVLLQSRSEDCNS